MSRSTYLSLQLRREFPFGERLCEDPLVHRFDAFVSDDECAHIIAVARPGLRRGEVSGEAGGVRSPGRSNDLTWVPHELDAVTSQVTARVADPVTVISSPPRRTRSTATAPTREALTMASPRIAAGRVLGERLTGSSGRSRWPPARPRARRCG